MKSNRILLVAHFGEDFVAYRSKFLGYLQDLGFNVQALVPKDKYAKEVKATGHKVTFFSYQRNVLAFLYFLPFYLKLKNLIKQEKINLVYTLKFFPNLIGVLAAKSINGVQACATIAGLGFLDKKNESIFIRLLFSIYMKVLNKADFVIIQNSDDLALLKPHLPHPKLVLTHGSGVDATRFEGFRSDPQKVLDKENLPLKEFVVFCSRIVREKGIFELIEGFLEAKAKQAINFNLIIAGWYDDKGLQVEIENKYKSAKGLHFLGYQSDVRNLISLASAIILPSYYPEGVPRSLTESLAMEKIILTTDHKGCRETCIDGENGFLIKPRSKAAIAEALIKFDNLKSPERESMQAASRKLFYEKFHQERVFETIVNELSLK